MKDITSWLNHSKKPNETQQVPIFSFVHLKNLWDVSLKHVWHEHWMGSMY
jgi:hypothetical protein